MPADYDEPGDRRENRADEIVGEQDAPHPDAREMARLAIVADGVEKTAEPRPPKAEQNEPANDEPQEEVDRRQSEELSCAKRLDDFGHMRLARHHMLAVDDERPARHEAGAERHDQRLDAQERDPDPVDDADDDADKSARPIAAVVPEEDALVASR